MNKEQLYKALENVNHSRDKRKEMAQMVLINPKLISLLFEIALEDNTHISSKACWVLEFSAKENIASILENIDDFTTTISIVKLDSSVRPMAKICEYLITAYFHKQENKTQASFTNAHLEKITNSCFDWLIGNHKVAAQAYSMTCLYLLGKKFDWIHPELKMVLEQNYSSGSAAYKARARLTLAKI